MINIADQLIEFSNKVGGARNVYEGHVSLLVGGFLFDKSELPTDGNVLPAGTPIYADEESRTIMIHYAFKVTGAGTSTGFKVVKGFEGTRVKVGMFLMVAPTTESGTGQSYKVTAVDSSNEEYDVVTTSATATAVTDGAVLVEASSLSATASIKCLPNALTDRDKRLDSNATQINGDAVWACDRPILERRIPPIADCIKAHLLSNYAAPCFFRFSNRK